MTTRRSFLGQTGLLGAALGAGTASAAAAAAPANSMEAELQHAIEQMPVDDSHCHPISKRDAHTSADGFLERLALSAFPAPDYFPAGVYDQWHKGDAATRARLDSQYGIAKTHRSMVWHFSQSVFVKAMVKEMASFLGCKPQLEAVIEARNARGGDYYRYMNDLFRDARIENVMIDTGYADGLDADGIHAFEAAVAPTKARYLARVETITDELFELDIGYEDLRDKFTSRVRDALDGTGNFGRRSWGMKSYLLPDIGVIRPTYDDAKAASSWKSFRATRGKQYQDRNEATQRGKVLRERLLTIALDECLERDMPMQFHAGDGEAPSVTLRNQHPYYLEEVARFDKNGLLRQPKIVPIHAGYPLVDEAAWLSHLYVNVYFEISLMNPFIHQGLLARFLQIMEAVPLSKILFGSDSYHVPEMYWLAARWGKRYLARALTVYVRDGLLSTDEALEAARMVLHLNNRRLYHLDPA